MAIIEVKGLKKNYGELEVLKSIDLEIEEGQVVCIIGPSGSGKSTFLRCLNRLEKTTEGKIWCFAFLNCFLLVAKSRLFQVFQTAV